MTAGDGRGSPPPPPLAPRDAVRVARTGLAVLTLINLFNYHDRWVVAAVAESIKRSELRLSDTELGALMTGFIIVYTLTAPVFGRLGDTRSRRTLIALGVAVWSVATALAGFARGFASLFLARATVGVGEAAYGTIAPSLLADYYPRERRGRAFAVFFAAIPIGSALGYVVGGLADPMVGWLGDSCLRFSRHAYLWVSGLATLLAAPLFLLALVATRPGPYWAALVTAQVLMFISTGPINSTIVNVVSPAIRATAVALSIFTIHTLGDVPSPALVGIISDARSLGEAVLILPAATLVGGLIWTYAGATAE